MGKYLHTAGSLLVGFLCWNFQTAALAADPATSNSSKSVTVSGGRQIIDASSITGSASLSVAKGAVAIIDFGKSSALNFTGNISNFGSIYAVSSNPAVKTANFNALNISNGAGGLLSSVIPAGGFLGMSNLVSNLHLSLNAIRNIVNAGTISSAGNLYMSAGNSIMNTASITAAQNVSMSTGVNGLVNSGVINAIAGNLNITNLASQNLIINNTNGTLQALLGNVNLSTVAANSLDKLDLSLIGGDVLSKALNIVTQEGAAKVDINQLSGVLNISAGSAATTSRTEMLNLGTMNITGDPVFFNTKGSIQITGDLLSSGNNLAILASGDITTSGSTAWNINTSSAGNGGSVMMIAGVSMTPNPPGSGTGGNTGGSADTTTSITLNGPSATGGSIDLTQGSGIASFNTSTTGANGNSGSVVLIAYGGAGKGTVTLPGSVTINTGTSSTSSASLNGAVTIIAGSTAGGQVISVGPISAGTNTASPGNTNGLVNIFSATPAMFQVANKSSTPISFTALNGAAVATQSYIYVTDSTNITPGQTLVLNPNGANPETVTVGSSYTPGKGILLVPLTSPLQLNHSSSEYVTDSVSSVTVYPNANSFLGPILQSGGMFAAGALQNGNISVGGITSGANVIIGTQATAGGGTVNLNGSIALTQNPLAGSPGTAFTLTPVLQVSGQTVNIPSTSTTVSSAISGCSFCQDQLNIYTQNLNNSGTISGTYVNIQNKSASTLTITNDGTVSGINPGSTAGNPWVNIQSAGSIAFASSAKHQGNYTVPSLGVISVTAADNNSISFNSTQGLNAGKNGLVTLSAQGGSGAVNFASGALLRSTGGALISISSPNLNFANNSGIKALGASSMIFTSGALTQSPQPLTISVASGGSAQILTTSGKSIILRPTDGQNINFNAKGGGTANLTFTGAPVYTFTGTKNGSAGKVMNNISVTATSSFKALDPNGGITGIAFEPYVGPAITFPGTFTGYATYTYPQVLLLMAPIAQSGLFQNLGTYTQGAFIGPNNPPANQKSSYIIVGAAQYTIQAAKQMGFTVTAGAYVENSDHSVNVPPTEAEIDFAMKQAVKYGNVSDMVIGNECIVGSPSLPSTQSLIQAMNYAQNLRNTSTSYNASTLPVTTRQTYGVLSGVNNSSFPERIVLLNGCTNCQATYGLLTPNFEGSNGHVYADVYPYYDGTNGSTGGASAGSVIGFLVGTTGTATTSLPTISSSNFNALVTSAKNPLVTPTTTAPTTGIQADLNGTLAAFSAQSITPQLWVAETGWATRSTQSNGGQTTALPNNAPQANLTWAGAYYPQMQKWSATNKSTYSLGYQIPINGYFEAYDEPWKYSATPWQGGEPNFGVWTATGTNTTASISFPPAAFQLTGITQNYSLPILNKTTGPFQAPPQSSSGLGATAPVVAPVLESSRLTNNLSAIAFNSAIESVNNSLGSTRGTIIPTDINPEIKSDESGSNLNSFGSEQANAKQANDVQSKANTNANTNTNTNANTNTNTNALFGLYSNQIQPGLLFNQAQVQINPKDEILTFSGSNLLLAPNKNTTVNTNLAQIQIDAGAAVMMIQTDGELAILALHDDHNGAVRVSVDGQTMEISVGRQLVLSKDHASVFDGVNLSKIGYRNLSDTKIGNLKAYQAEFSLASALSKTQAIRQLMKSSEKDKQDLARKLLKTAASMVIVGRDKAPFKPSRS